MLYTNNRVSDYKSLREIETKENTSSVRGLMENKKNAINYQKTP